MKNKITKKSTIRDVMQILGTELLKNSFNKNIHVASTLGHIRENENIIITDTRFENEANAIKDRGGVIIRVNRNYCDTSKECAGRLISGDNCENCPYKPFTHISETELDNYKFDYVIDNNGTIEELIEKVKEMLEDFKII